jgi:ribonucleoside-triphosphate reductase
MHIFLGEEVNDLTTLKSLIRKIARNYRLPYFTLTPTFSICPTHGYLSGEQPTCTRCGRQTEVYSRVVGYLRPVRQWNDGKLAEYGNRKVFKGITGREAPEASIVSPAPPKPFRTAVSAEEKSGLADYAPSQDGGMQAVHQA